MAGTPFVLLRDSNLRKPANHFKSINIIKFRLSGLLLGIEMHHVTICQLVTTRTEVNKKLKIIGYITQLILHLYVICSTLSATFPSTYTIDASIYYHTPKGFGNRETTYNWYFTLDIIYIL